MFEGLREELGIDSYVSLNGQYVVYEGKPVYKNPIATSVLEELTLFAEKLDHPVAYTDTAGMRVNVADHEYINTSVGSLKLVFPTHDAGYFLKNDIYQAMIFCPQESQQIYAERYPEPEFHPLAPAVYGCAARQRLQSEWDRGDVEGDRGEEGRGLCFWRWPE